MQIQAIVLDRDGVLLDFDLVAAARFFSTLVPCSLAELDARMHARGSRHGYPRSEAEEKAFLKSYWDEICDEFELPGSTRQKLHSFNYTTLVAPYPEVHASLSLARGQGMKIGVLSNFPFASLQETLQAARLADLVDVACAATVIGHSKPQPESYLTVSERLQIAPQNTLFFDDEEPHIEGARRVGMAAFLVDRQRKRHDIPGGVVRDLTPIPDIVEFLNGS